MDDQNPSNPAPVPTDGSVPSTHQAVLDANGFDPAAFEWRPVPRRPRADGWTPEVQQRFIAALMRLGVVERACEEVGMSVSSAYALRNAPGGEGFARAWKEALTRAADRMLDLAFEQVMLGEEVPVHDRDGVRVGVRWKLNTRLMMFMLRAYHPERFRFAHQETRRPDEPPAVAASPADVVAGLAPETPADPHLLAPPERRDQLIGQARWDAARLAADPPDDRESYRHPRIPDDHPRVRERARRNRLLRERQESRQDDALGLDLASTSDDARADDPPGDPLTDYTYWAASEEGRRAIAEEKARNRARSKGRRRSSRQSDAAEPAGSEAPPAKAR